MWCFYRGRKNLWTVIQRKKKAKIKEIVIVKKWAVGEKFDGYLSVEIGGGEGGAGRRRRRWKRVSGWICHLFLSAYGGGCVGEQERSGFIIL